MSEREQYEMGVQADAVLRLGMLLMSAGTSGYRVMRGMKRAARAIGFDELDVVVGLTQITCTFHRGHNFRTVVSRTHKLAVDASRIEAIENYTHHLDHTITAQELNAKLDQIEQTVVKRWKGPFLVVAAAFACAAFAVLNKFTWAEVGLVAVAAGVGQYTRVVFQKRHVHQLGGIIAAGAAACLTFYLIALVLSAVGIVDLAQFSSGYVAAVLFLIPGFPLFSAMIDLARFDFEAGIARLTYALTIIATATFSVGMLSWVTGLNPEPTYVKEGINSEVGWFLLVAAASFIGIGGFAFLFNSSRRMMLIAASVGMIANVVRFILLDMGATNYFASFISGFLIGLVGAVASNKVGLPRITTTVPACVILIPGPSMFRSVYYLNSGDMDLALSHAATAAMSILAISAGLVLSRMLTDRDWTLGKLIDLHKPLANEHSA